MKTRALEYLQGLKEHQDWGWVALGMFGAYLAADGRAWWAQAVWVVSNAGIALYNFRRREWAWACMFSAFLLLAVRGVINLWPWGG